MSEPSVQTVTISGMAGNGPDGMVNALLNAHKSLSSTPPEHASKITWHGMYEMQRDVYDSWDGSLHPYAMHCRCANAMLEIFNSI